MRIVINFLLNIIQNNDYIVLIFLVGVIGAYERWAVLHSPSATCWLGMSSCPGRRETLLQVLINEYGGAKSCWSYVAELVSQQLNNLRVLPKRIDIISLV